MRPGRIASASLFLPLLVGFQSQEVLDTPKDYVVGIEDKLRLYVFGEEDLSLTVTVRPDGKITMPLINDIAVAGHTPDEIRREIQRRLTEGRIVVDPNVSVIVDEINSYRVYFLGEVQDQGPLLFHRPTRLLQGIAAAGGLTEFSKKRITLLREQGGVERRIEIDYKQLISGAPGQENLFLLPGDTLLVQ
jgi:polysaccharide export outer membrane protein